MIEPPPAHRITAARWQAAQKLELDFWSRWSSLPPFQNLDIPTYWREELVRFDATLASFRGQRVLDIGCGPFGLIHFVDQAAVRIRIDPLLLHYRQKLPLDGPQLSLVAVAESLPLAGISVDLVVCFNALDHMQDPQSALDEIARVLRPGGMALFMIHTFPGWLSPFFWLDRIHPHHYTARSFAALVREHFIVERCETVRRRFEVPPAKRLLPSTWKYMAANFVVSSTYVRAKKLG